MRKSAPPKTRPACARTCKSVRRVDYPRVLSGYQAGFPVQPCGRADRSSSPGRWVHGTNSRFQPTTARGVPCAQRPAPSILRRVNAGEASRRSGPQALAVRSGEMPSRRCGGGRFGQGRARLYRRRRGVLPLRASVAQAAPGGRSPGQDGVIGRSVRLSPSFELWIGVEGIFRVD
jgi:hypothetical protein